MTTRDKIISMAREEGSIGLAILAGSKEGVDILERFHALVIAEHEREKAEQRQEPVAWRAWSDAHGYTVWETLKEAEHYSDEDHDPEPLDLRHSRELSTCEWLQVDEDEGVYETDCKNMHMLTGEPPHDWMKFCCYCGKPATIKLWSPENDHT